MKKIINKIFEAIMLSSFILRFDDPQLEDQFIEKTYVQNYTYNKIIYIFGFFLFSIFFILLYIFFSNEEDNTFLIFPFALNLVTSIITLIIMHIDSKFIRRFLSSFILVSILIGVFSLMLIMVYHIPINLHITHCGMLLLIISGFAFIRIQFPYALIYMLGTILLYEIFLINFANFNFTELILNQFLFACTIFIGITVNYYIEKKERHNFLKLIIIVEERLKLSNLDETINS